MQSLSSHSSLVTCGLHYPDVIWQEYFGLPKEAEPQTIAELADLRQRHPDHIIQHIRKIIGWHEDLAFDLPREEFTGAWLWLDPTPPSRESHRQIFFVDPYRFEETFAAMQQQPAILTIADDPRRAYSFALFLRQHGLARARYWAIRTNPK